MRGLEIVVEHPVHRHAPVRGIVDGVGLLDRVRPQQVVQDVPTRPVLGDQVDIGQVGEPAPRDPLLGAGEAGRRGRADVRAGVQAEQPEQPGRRRTDPRERP
jgi:hypothetical protein